LSVKLQQPYPSNEILRNEISLSFVRLKSIKTHP
jgi:hypothetical protein